jgi:phage shock protein PspC (stress-responsive transcriptional regulator)
MKKVITINLNGIAFQLEEDGFDALRAYLDSAAGKLVNNPDRDEIMSDIERAIADKFRALLGAYKTVVLTKEVSAVIAEMGPVDGGSETEDDTAASGAAPGGKAHGGASTTGSGPAKRLYRIYDGAMIRGVCNGIAAYFGIDPTFVRLAFVVLAVITKGIAIPIYIVLAFVIPSAKTSEEKAAAEGAPFTAQEFIKRAREGYYEGAKAWSDRHARRAWKRKFRRDMRDWGRGFQWECQTGAQNWRQYWAHNLHVDAPGWGIAMPFVSLLNAALVIGALAVLVSLLSTGGVFGHGIPGGLPVWAAIILLFFAYQFVSLPLKATRHAFFYYGGAPRRPWFLFWDALVGMACVFVIVWLVTHHRSDVQEAIHSIPATVHHAIDSVRDWWHSR